MENRLYEKYRNDIVPALVKDLELSSVMEAPQVQKVVINAGIGGFKDDRAALEAFLEEVSLISGQKPVLRKARLSEAGFKIKKGEDVGVTVTLRGKKMWAFLDKLINVVLPRVRDFRGVKETAFDEKGNYSLGLREHTLFPEVNPNTVKGIRSLEVTVVTSAKNKEIGKKLLTAIGMPFRKES